jgi:hypothetical protein
MAISTFEGYVEHGQIRVPDNIRLPDNTKVYVLVPEVGTIPSARILSPRLARPEQASDFAKEVTEISTDAGV